MNCSSAYARTLAPKHANAHVHACAYTHTQVKIGNNCSVGKKSTVMHSTELEDGVTVGDLTLIMKGEVCHKNGQYDGLPSQAS